ncbi:hypothetical protein AHAS_Ahas20G0267900 [Arachis hypogaea]
MFSHQLPLPKFRNAKFPKFKLGILQARYPLVDFASSSPPPPSDTTTGDHHRLPSLSSFFSFFPIFPFLRSCVRHPCSWSHPLSASSSTDKQPPAAATFCATATSPPPHRLSFHQCRVPSPVPCLSFLYFHCFLILFLEILVRLRFVKTCVSGLKLLLAVSF